MSVPTIEPYASITKQVIIYLGTPIFVIGIIGEILSTLVFLSLQTFRQSSCAFYLTIMSIVNTIYLLVGVFPGSLTTIYNIDGTAISLFYCKFRNYFTTICTTISMTCFCLATIDQYCATSSRPHFQQWCNIKLAQRLVIIFSIIWILHATPYLFLFYHNISPVTGTVMCVMTDTIYLNYRTYVIVLILYCIVPVSVSMIFGSMAFINVQRLACYTVPLVRRELDKQLTVMVLVEVVVNFFVITPYMIIHIIQLNTIFNPYSISVAQIQLVYNVLFMIYYLYFACPFYIYICVSERFRRQLIYVLFKIHLHRCTQQPRIVNNQVIPQ